MNPGGISLKGYVSVSDNQEKPAGKVPNSVMRDLLLFLDRQLGHRAYRGVLNLAGMHAYLRALPPNNMHEEVNAADYLAVLGGLQDYYDERGAAAVLRELGRSTVRRAVIHAVGLAEQTGSLDGKQLLRLALNALAQSTALGDRRLILLQDSGDMLLVSTRQPACWAPDPKGRACEVVMGAMRGSLEMVSGRPLQVRAIACCLNGAHHCVFEVARAGRWR
jgi:predicted hydrocarbon binding protein